MSELGEQTKSIAQRKDADLDVIKRRDFFTFFDHSVIKPNGEISQTAKFENNGVLKGSAKLITGLQNLFDISFEITYPPEPIFETPLPMIHGENLVLLAQTVNGEVYGSEGKLEPQEGAQQVTFRSWQQLDPQIIEIAANRQKGIVLKAVRRGRPTPFPAVPRNHLEEINFVFA